MELDEGCALWEVRNMKVKIQCHSCDGCGFVHDVEYKTLKDVVLLCPECNGKGYVEDEKYEGTVT